MDRGDDAEDDSRDDYRVYKAMPPVHQKPGGPCDHCGAVGTYPATNLHRAFLPRAPEPFFPRWRAGFPPFARRCRPMRSRISRSRAHPESHASLMNGS